MEAIISDAIQDYDAAGETHAGRTSKLQAVPATVIVGAQWGDEGKGKIVDLLAQHSDVVCRYQGGPNAGHTIVAGGETFKIRQIPSGVVTGKTNVIGAGCVVDPEVFLAEVDELEARGCSTADVHLSGEAHLIMPWHVAIDGASERRLGKLQIGTTRRGIGPCYADKAMRLGIRVQDLLDPKILRQKIEVALAEKNLWLERVYGVEPLDLERARRAAGGLRAADPPVHRGHLAPRRSGAPGGQGACCSRERRGRSSTSTTARIRSSPRRTRSRRTRRRAIGLGPNRIDRVLGVAKAYVTRVGEGPFPTEIEGPDQARVRELGGEFGTVTGRERRCGWLDLVGLRFAVRVNGITSLALTKLDVLSAFEELPVCVRYRLADGTETDELPAHQSDFHHARPVYETLAGWAEPLDDVEPSTSCPTRRGATSSSWRRRSASSVTMIGTGADRERVLTPRGLAAAVRLRAGPGRPARSRSASRPGSTSTTAVSSSAERVAER